MSNCDDPFQICFLCMKTRFGFFSWGVRCQLCKQQVCSKCSTKVRYIIIAIVSDSTCIWIVVLIFSTSMAFLYFHRWGFRWSTSRGSRSPRFRGRLRQGSRRRRRQTRRTRTRWGRPRRRQRCGVETRDWLIGRSRYTTLRNSKSKLRWEPLVFHS